MSDISEKTYQNLSIVDALLLVVKKLVGRTIHAWWFMRDFIVFCIIAPPLLAVYPFYKIKFVLIDGSRIGPLITDSEMVFRTFRRDNVKPKIHYIGLVSTIVSEPVKNILQREMPFIISPLLHGSLSGMTSFFKPLKKMPFVVVRELSNWASTFNQYKSRIEFTEEEKIIGEACLREMGIGENDWFVCFHAREDVYLKSEYPDNDWSHHGYRDSSINNCIKSMEEIIKYGGFAVRIGAKGDTALDDIDTSKIIDYANSKFKSQFLDIYLAAKCRFSIVGGGSGIGFASTLFDVPVGWVNVFPTSPGWWQKNNMFIPKLFKAKDSGRYITFAEMSDMGLITPISGTRDLDFFNENGLKIIENTDDEILGLCMEMLDLTKKNGSSSELTKLQHEFKDKFFSENENNKDAANISSYFINKYSSLLD